MLNNSLSLGSKTLRVCPPEQLWLFFAGPQFFEEKMHRTNGWEIHQTNHQLLLNAYVKHFTWICFFTSSYNVVIRLISESSLGNHCMLGWGCQARKPEVTIFSQHFPGHTPSQWVSDLADRMQTPLSHLPWSSICQHACMLLSPSSEQGDGKASLVHTTSYTKHSEFHTFPHS